MDAKKIEYEKEQEKYIPLILNSNIDFSKNGWVKQVAKIINKRHQKVNTWMQRFMLEFYKEKCFKRRKVALPQKYKNKEEFQNTIKQQAYERNKKYISLIENSNIDFSKQGWVYLVATLLNKEYRDVYKWMKLYMPTFYKEKCFMRSNKTPS